MRLIDADAFEKFIKEKYKDNESTDDIKDQMLFDLSYQPTAYSVEKVVAELEKKSNDVISNHFAYEDDDHTGIYNDGLSDGYEYAIDIVKRGGAE